MTGRHNQLFAVWLFSGGVWLTHIVPPIFSLRCGPEVKLSVNRPAECLVAWLSLPARQQLVPKVSNMQVIGREHRPPPVKTGGSVANLQINNRGPCPVCKKHFPELKLGPFIKHRYHCKGKISQREVSCLPANRDNDSRLSNKKCSCPFCSEVFGTASSLKAHLLLHTGEKPYECSRCHECFTFRGDLSAHRRLHRGEKRFKCEQCNKCFVHNNALRVHQRTHTGEKPYECTQCHKHFTQKGSLTKHLRLHTGLHAVLHTGLHMGEKPFECKLCGKCFAYESILIIHMRSHTGEKPFECGQCHKRFTQSGNLTVHERLHMVKNPYK